MDITTYEVLGKPVEVYHRVRVSSITFDDNKLMIAGIGDFNVTPDLFTTFCRFVGISKGLNESLRKLDKDLWEQVIYKLYQNNYEDEIVIKLQDDELIGISNYEKDPIGNVRFIDRIISQFEDLVDVEIDEINYNPKKQHASVIVLNTAKHLLHGKEYQVGVVVENDSLYGANVRMVSKQDDSYAYGTSGVFNLSSARYNRTSDTGIDALNNMLVTLADALRSDLFTTAVVKRLEDAIYREDNVFITYEEYYRTRLAIQRALALSQFDEDTVKKFIEDYRDLFDFYKNYTSVQEADPIWRETAYSDKHVSIARLHLSELSNNPSLVYEAVRDIRSLAGELLFGKLLYSSIAMRA